MKKILNIISIPQANQCASLQTDYKIQRKNLKRYQQSLKTFKQRIIQNVTQLQYISKSISTMHQNQSKSKKKISQIQYYMYNGVKIFGSLVSMFSKSHQYYQQLYKRIINTQNKISKILIQHKKRYEKLSELHEKQVKNYAAQCYPQTSSILFIIGFLSTQKILKKIDSFRQTSLIEQSKRYAKFLNNILDQMQQLKKQTILIGQDFYQGAKNMWIDQIQETKQNLQSFKIDTQQIQKIADQTGRVLTDRSIRSNDNQNCNQEQNHYQDANQEQINNNDNNKNNNQAENRENEERGNFENQQHHDQGNQQQA